MSDIAVRAENLSKRYRIGERERYYTLRDSLAYLFAAPLRRLSNGRQESNTASLLPSASVSQAASGEPRSEFHWALKDVSFEIKHGEVVGIIGRNGAGKSTLLKILSQITEPTEGEARVHGRVGSLLEVGTGFHPELTGRENIYLNGAILGMKKKEIERKFDEIVTFAEIERFLDTPVKHYSSGMHMRLAFSVAAHLEPEILLVDEVLAVGDMAFQKKCLGKMENVAHDGRTVLFVSHNIAAVKALCSSAILLDEGKKVADGKVEGVVDHYLQTPANEGPAATIEPRTHRNSTGELWIAQIALENASGCPAAQLRIGEDFRLRIRFEIRQPVREIRIGVGFNTLEGVRIATMHHTDSGGELLSRSPGVYEISLKTVNPLLPGRYVISTGAHRALGGQTVDYVPEALRFDVLDVPAGGNHFEVYNPGLVRFEALWQPPRQLV